MDSGRREETGMVASVGVGRLCRHDPAPATRNQQGPNVCTSSSIGCLVVLRYARRIDLSTDRPASHLADVGELPKHGRKGVVSSHDLPYGEVGRPRIIRQHLDSAIHSPFRVDLELFCSALAFELSTGRCPHTIQ